MRASLDARFFIGGSMKLLIQSIFLLGAMLPFFTLAQVNVSLHKDIEVLAINGEALPMSFISKQKMTLENGTNQLLIRVSKLIESGADFEKFKTDPLVITFDASNEELTIEPEKIIFSQRQVSDFKKNPSFILNNEAGLLLASNQAILPADSGMMRDYEKELIKFNRKRNLVIASQKTDPSFIAEEVLPVSATLAAVPVPSPIVPIQPQAVIKQTSNHQTKSSAENSLILMKADFLRMDSDEKKAFLRWAVKNVKA